MIEPGSIRLTVASTGLQYVFAPNENGYRLYIDVAQERFDKVTRQWIKIPAHYPKHIVDGDDYRVYLDGQIVPWWNQADSERGFVDVWASVRAEGWMAHPMDKVQHRLFGVVTFEPKVLSEINASKEISQRST